jgi:FAD/FMN-containing dehydrogenases
MSQTITRVLGEATVQELREAVRGEVLTPDDDGYAEARRIWNGAHDGRRPAVIVRCTGAADVIAAVGFAHSNNLTIAVRGGGHSIAGFSTYDDGIVIDLSPMNGVHVDTEAQRATVGAVPCGPTSTTKRRRTGSPPPAASSRRRRGRVHARRRHRLADAETRPRL